MTVGVGEVDGPRRHPLVEDGPLDSNTSLLEGRRCRLDIRLIDREGKMLRRPRALVFLQHHHSRLPPGPQEQDISAFVPNTDFETQDLSVERLGLGEVLDTDGYFVETTNG